MLNAVFQRSSDASVIHYGTVFFIVLNNLDTIGFAPDIK